MTSEIDDISDDDSVDDKLDADDDSDQFWSLHKRKNELRRLKLTQRSVKSSSLREVVQVNSSIGEDSNNKDSPKDTAACASAGNNIVEASDVAGGLDAKKAERLRRAKELRGHFKIQVHDENSTNLKLKPYLDIAP